MTNFKPKDLSILSWNIQGSHHFPRTNFNRIAPSLNAIGADIICLQESQAAYQHRHGMKLDQFHRTMPPTVQNGNSIYSAHPIRNSDILIFPETIAEHGDFEQALWADIGVDSTTVRIYNCHLAIRGIGPKERIAQFRYILDHANDHPGPTIICGDMNTTIPASGIKRRIVQWFHAEPATSMMVDGKLIEDDERYPFAVVAGSHGFTEAIELHRSTWSLSPRLGWEAFNLKLDWFFVRNLALPNVTLGDYISDHRSVLATW